MHMDPWSTHRVYYTESKCTYEKRERRRKKKKKNKKKRKRKKRAQ